MSDVTECMCVCVVSDLVFSLFCFSSFFFTSVANVQASDFLVEIAATAADNNNKKRWFTKHIADEMLMWGRNWKCCVCVCGVMTYGGTSGSIDKRRQQQQRWMLNDRTNASVARIYTYSERVFLLCVCVSVVCIDKLCNLLSSHTHTH